MPNSTEQMLGILGGMGPQATETLYQWIIDRTPAASDQEHIPTLILSDSHMPDRTTAILSGKTDVVYNRLLRDANILANSGCSCIAIPCNTSHYFADRLQAEIQIPIIHMPRLTAQRLKDAGCRKAAILATDGTIQTGVYARELEKLGIQCWTPDTAVQKTVMSLIYDQIKKGEHGREETFAIIDQAARNAGCDRAILGCTELSVYREFHHLDSFYIDAMEVLAEECVKFFGLEPKKGD